MSTVTVLCPNARRQQVKVNANLKILEIIEEVCKKQGYDPNEYELVHQKKVLDVTLTFRLSGIPNNAVLELKKSEQGPRKYDDVTISLQLEDGTRLPPLQFKPDTTTLKDLIEQNQAASEAVRQALDEDLVSKSNNYPVCTYLNEQIVGVYQLKNTTLKDLGLTNGRVIVRLFMKHFDKETIEKLDSEFSLKLEKKQKLDEIFRKKQLEEQKYLEEQEKRNLVRREAETAAAEFEKIKQESEAAKSLQERSNRPVANEPTTKTTSTTTTKPTTSNQQQNNQLTSSMTMSMDYDIVEYKNETSNNDFKNFKFPEETKGKDLSSQNELAEIEKQSKEPCDRQATMFDNIQKVDSSTSNATASNAVDDLPEDFFEVNVNDLQYMLSDLKRAQNEEAPLMTKKLRELEQDKKAMKYTQVVVRVSFKDRYVLQGFFRPKEKIKALYDFVKDSFSLKENSKDDLDFHLYTTPPKVTYNDMNRTLFEEHLYPASIVYFKNKSDRLPVFKPELMGANFKTIHEANEMVYKNVHQTMRKIDHEGMNYLYKEQTVLNNIMRSSGLLSSADPRSSNQSSSRTVADNQRDSSSSSSSDVNKKLERFLKGSKK